ncbi:MAG: hypothetical protein ACTHJM_08880, partial [Marmoricola sp.]
MDGNQHPNIGVMVMDTPSQGISLCSGSLVKSSTYGEIFLSASHCGWGGGQGQVVGISFDPNAINWNSTSSSIAGMFNPGVVVHYAKLFWNTAFRQCCFGTSTSAVPAYSDEDISVAVFNTDDMPTGISRLPIAPIGSVDSLALGSTITDVGYGITGPNN